MAVNGYSLATAPLEIFFRKDAVVDTIVHGPDRALLFSMVLV
jgi:hypothetical protein